MITDRSNIHVYSAVYRERKITHPLRLDLVPSYADKLLVFRLSTKLYRQIVGIPIGTNCDPLVADLF